MLKIFQIQSNHAVVHSVLAAVVTTMILLVGCGSPEVDKPSPSEKTAGASNDHDQNASVEEPAGALRMEKLQIAHLPNAIRLNEKVISGGQPEGEQGFAELKELGIQTIISVDGATPDVKAAEDLGMRYVHLPHGYNGVSQLRAQELAKCVATLPGPIYIHCHHGKHRSPAAATVASIGAGLMRSADGLAVLKAAGTNPNYKGLYQAAESAQQFDKELLDQLQCEFPKIAKLPPMAEAMVQLEHTFDHIKMLQENDWLPLKKHPDLSAAHESLILMEHFKEMLRDHTESNPSEDFQALVQQSIDLSEKLHAQFSDGTTAKDTRSYLEANQWLAEIHSACKECHQRFRDIPLDRN